MRVGGWWSEARRQRGAGRLAFDDAIDEVGGTWALGRPAESEPGLVIYIAVDSVPATVESVLANGGVARWDGRTRITARFRDPGGNVIGLYQEPNPPSQRACHRRPVLPNIRETGVEYRGGD